MSLQPVARLGDVSDHGGSITGNCSGRVLTDGVPTAFTGSLHTCPVPGHGITAMTGTGIATVDGANKVRVGDRAACGAAILAGSPTVTSA